MNYYRLIDSFIDYLKSFILIYNGSFTNFGLQVTTDNLLY